MLVTVELKGYLNRYSPAGQSTFQLDVPDGATVLTLAGRLSVPDEMATVVVINGRNADVDDELAEGDVVTLIPPLSGG